MVSDSARPLHYSSLSYAQIGNPSLCGIIVVVLKGPFVDWSNARTIIFRGNVRLTLVLVCNPGGVMANGLVNGGCCNRCNINSMFHSIAATVFSIDDILPNLMCMSVSFN